MIGGVSLLDALRAGTTGSAAAAVAPQPMMTTTGAAPSAFSDKVQEAASRTIGTLNHAEKLSFQALQGDVDTRAVVDAVMSAEQSLQTAIAIRDKIVNRLSRNEPHGHLRTYDESPDDRSYRHGRAADQSRGHREQYRQHQHDRLQARPRGILRPALSGGPAAGRAQPANQNIVPEGASIGLA